MHTQLSKCLRLDKSESRANQCPKRAPSPTPSERSPTMVEEMEGCRRSSLSIPYSYPVLSPPRLLILILILVVNDLLILLSSLVLAAAFLSSGHILRVWHSEASEHYPAHAVVVWRSSSRSVAILFLTAHDSWLFTAAQSVWNRSQFLD